MAIVCVVWHLVNPPNDDLMFLMSLERLNPADVAELVDALVSGTSDSNVVGVQVSPSALS